MMLRVRPLSGSIGLYTRKGTNYETSLRDESVNGRWSRGQEL